MCVCQDTENNLWKSVFSFHYVGPRDKTQVIRLGSDHHFPNEPLCWPNVIVFIS